MCFPSFLKVLLKWWRVVYDSNLPIEIKPSLSPLVPRWQSFCNPVDILKCFMLTFPIYLFTNKISKKNWIFLGGYPPYGPSKNEASQKWRPMTAHNPYFLLQNPILLSKWGCLQKTRPQYLKNWLSYSHFKFENFCFEFFV